MPVIRRSIRRRLSRLVLPLALVPVLTACATAIVPPADVRTPSAFETPRPTTDSVSAAALDQWWLLYHDDQLSQLIAQALAASPNARDAAAKLEQARAVRSAALVAYGPQGNIASSITREQFAPLESDAALATALSGLSTTSTGFGGGGGGGFGGAPISANSTVSQTSQLGFNVTWELDLFGRRASARKAVNADLLTAAFTAYATRWSLTANVADSLFQARGLSLQLSETKSTLASQQRLLDIASAKASHGLVPLSDKAQAQSNVLTSKAEVDALQAQLDAARRALLVLIGRGTDPLDSLPVGDQLGAPPPAPLTLPADLLVRRPDVREAQQRVISATGTLNLDQKALLPTFTFQPGAGILQETVSPNSRLGFWSIGGSFSLPVLDRPRLLAQVRQQRAVAEQAVIAYESSVQTAYGDAETAFIYYGSDSRRLALLSDAETAAETAYHAKFIGYQRGLNDLQTALTAEQAWRQARISRASAQTTLMQRSVQLFKALGGGWTPPSGAKRIG